MRCHFIHDQIAGKVLIPGCDNAAVYGDIDFCTCRPHSHIYFEKEKFKKVVKEMEVEIQYLHDELNRLNRRIEAFSN